MGDNLKYIISNWVKQTVGTGVFKHTKSKFGFFFGEFVLDSFAPVGFGQFQYKLITVV